MLLVEDIKKLKKGEPGKAVLAVLNAEVRETARKTHFLNLTVGDKTGSLGAKIWDWNTSNEPLAVGEALGIHFEFSPFNDSPQIVIREYEVLDKSKIDAGRFLDTLTQDEFKFYRNELQSLIDKIKDKDLNEFVTKTIYEIYPEYLSAPGAKQLHHARLGGLMQHSIHVTRNAVALANTYMDVDKGELVNMDLLIAGALLHDLGKIYDYGTDTLVIDYKLPFTLAGQHGLNPALLMKSWMQTGQKISWETLLGLIHIQLSHHGPEHGLVPPATFSAWLIHCADLADAKATIVAENLEDSFVSPSKIFGIGNKIVDERQLK